MGKSIWEKISCLIKWLTGQKKHDNIETEPPPCHHNAVESVAPTQDNQPAPEGHLDTPDLNSQKNTDKSKTSLENTEETETAPSNSVPLAPTDNEEGTLRKPPGNFGGRRNPHPTPSSPRERNDHAFTRKPELICRKPDGSRQWEIILSTRQVHGITAVRHGETLLFTDDGEYCVSSFRGNLSVEYDDDFPDEVLPFDVKEPLIFKLQKNWTGDGYKISCVTQGYFIVFAPREWKRTGEVKIEPEECKGGQFLAHYFYKGKDDVESSIGGFEEYRVLPTRARFVLYGERLIDDSEAGELFVTDSPQIKPAADIVWARVGEERRGGWSGETFRPADKSLRDVLAGRQGRFYIRVYNNKSELVDSGEFRYCIDLREIRVNGKSYSRDTVLTPAPVGHPATKVQFIGAGERHIQPGTDNIHAVGGLEGVVTIAPIREGDKTIFTLASKTGSVDVVIELPRIWWRLEQDEEHPQAWLDTPLIMRREKYRTYARENAVVRLCLPPRIKTVDVGFDENLNRTLPVADGLRFKDFVDYAQIDNPLEKDAELRILCGEGAATAIIRITADPTSPTLPTLNRRRASFAKVRKGKGGGFRPGKGFSCGELRGAGLNENEVVNFGVHIDKRRRSMHQLNIDALNEIKNHA